MVGHTYLPDKWPISGSKTLMTSHSGDGKGVKSNT